MSVKKEKKLETAALKTGMCEKTARKYLKAGKPPSELKKAYTFKYPMENPFKDIWNKSIDFLEHNPGIEAKSLFEYFQSEYPGKYDDGELRTFQRKVKEWKATEGPCKEVFFPQEHHPGELCEADFTNMNHLNITINKEKFNHLLFHFVLTYSNWEAGSMCYSESFESLSEGLQNALWTLGGVPKTLRTDNLSAAIYKDLNKKVFTDRYHALLKHYNLQGASINPGNPHENGDIEQSNNRFKKAVEQSLILRGSRDFSSIEEYNMFLEKLFDQINSGRIKRFTEDFKELKSLPKSRLDAFKELQLTVGKSSTIHVAHNTYSVDSRLIKEKIKVWQKANHIEIYYGNKKIDEFPRLRGESKYYIQYRHIIDSLIRKPGAFENLKYRDDLFPTVRFRMAYDYFKSKYQSTASKRYLEILYLAAKESETEVDNALRILFDRQEDIALKAINDIRKNEVIDSLTNVTISNVDLKIYDNLIENLEVLHG